MELEAANLYSIIVADTKDESIGDTTAIDFLRMRREVKKIAQNTGLDLKEINFQENGVRPLLVLSQLDQLMVNSDDVVIFYFSGHGFRTVRKGVDPWPVLHFTIVDEGVELSFIKEKLEKKQPRFLLVIADVCNSYTPSRYAPPLICKMFGPTPDQEILRANYQSLFLESEGTLIITSSKKGEPSWCSDTGGLFTGALLHSISRAVKRCDYPDWEVILGESYQCISEVQHPQWEFTDSK